VTAANFAFPNAFKQPIEVEESGAEFWVKLLEQVRMGL
jgi:hypothetical protein